MVRFLGTFKTASPRALSDTVKKWSSHLAMRNWSGKAGPQLSGTKAASIYMRDNHLFIFTQSRTTTGLWIEEGPVVTVPVTAVGKIGDVARDRLSASKDGVRHPTQEEWPERDRAFAKALGARSFGTFTKGAKCLNLRIDGERIVIVPTNNEGRRRGFTQIEEKARDAGGPEAELGAQIMRALDDCL